MNPAIDDQMVLISQYYPDQNFGHFLPQQDEMGVVNPKSRRRRKKNKSDEHCGGDAIRKRKLSEEQVKRLEESFGNDHKLESERKDKLAAELGLDPRQVAVWFQNRRARWKSKTLEEEYSKLKSKHDSTVLEKCRLQTELLKLKEQLIEAGKEIQRLSERWEGFSSNSPTSSFSMEAMQQEAPFLGDFEMATDLDNLFYAPQEKYVNGLEWDNLYYYM